MKKRKSPFLIFMCCVLAVPTCGVLVGELAIPSGLASDALLDILRSYLELRFSLPFSRQTTAELLPELANADSPLPEKFRAPLGAFLTSADMIRFAKAPSSPEKLDEALEQLSQLVRATIPESGNPTTTTTSNTESADV